MSIHLGNSVEEEELVATNPFAFLLAMLLDQQISIVWAFKGPNTILQKLHAAGLTEREYSDLSPRRIDSLDKDVFVELVCTKPTVHRYPAVMAKRIHELAHCIVQEYDGAASTIWEEQDSAEIVYQRLLQLPGFGKEKTQITLASLVKRFGYTLHDWELFAGSFADQEPRSVADAGSPEDYERIKKWKKAQRQKGLAKTD